jgi:hypothetical protein
MDPHTRPPPRPVRDELNRVHDSLRPPGPSIDPRSTNKLEAILETVRDGVFETVRRLLSGLRRR